MQLRRHIRGDAFVAVTDVTAGQARINVHGPKSRELLNHVSSVDLSKKAFPFMTAQKIDVGYACVLAMRVTFVEKRDGNCACRRRKPCRSMICE